MYIRVSLKVAKHHWPLSHTQNRKVIGSTAFGFIIAMVTVIVEAMDPRVSRPSRLLPGRVFKTMLADPFFDLLKAHVFDCLEVKSLHRRWVSGGFKGFGFRQRVICVPSTVICITST